MKTLLTILTTMTLSAGLSLAPALIRAPAYAVDNMSSTDAPDLTSVRAKIKAKDWKNAVADLNGMIDKGVQHAVHALKYLPGYRLVIIGRGPYKAELKRQVDSLGLGSRVKFMEGLLRRELLRWLSG